MPCPSGAQNFHRITHTGAASNAWREGSVYQNGQWNFAKIPLFAKMGAGALGFRDFPGLMVAKENRTGSHQTLYPSKFL
jgi:hypothetical protein